jgi:hypothetical protein
MPTLTIPLNTYLSIYKTGTTYPPNPNGLALFEPALQVKQQLSAGSYRYEVGAFKFFVTGLPAGATVTTATVTVFVTSRSNDDSLTSLIGEYYLPAAGYGSVSYKLPPTGGAFDIDPAALSVGGNNIISLQNFASKIANSQYLGIRMGFPDAEPAGVNALVFDPTGNSAPVLTLTYQLVSAPTSLAPNGTQISSAVDNTFSWQHNDGSGLPQTSYELRWRVSGGSYTTVSGTTPNNFHLFSASYFPSGTHTIEWNIRTSSGGAFSDWSGQASVVVGVAPGPPTVTDPTGTITSSRPDIEWASTSQVAYQAQILTDPAGVIVYDSGKVISVALLQAIDVDLVDLTDYIARVRIWNADDIPSAYDTESFTTVFTPPNVPTLTLSAATSGSTTTGIKITPNNPTGGETVASNEIFRRKTGTSDAFVSIASGLTPGTPAGQTWDDNLVGSGVSYDYFVRAHATNGAYADSTVSAFSVTITGLSLTPVDNPSGVLILDLTVQQGQDGTIAEEEELNAAIFQPVNRDPIIRSGGERKSTVTIVGNLVGSARTQYNDLLALFAAATELVLRHPFGGTFQGFIVNPPSRTPYFGMDAIGFRFEGKRL